MLPRFDLGPDRGRRRTRAHRPRVEGMEPKLALSGLAGAAGVAAHPMAVPGPTLPPRILSLDSTTFTVGVAGRFTVSSVGGPIPRVTESGTLPTGVTFVDNGDGSATLGGTPAAGTAGVYPFTITASNGVGPDATEAFTLTINQGPSITSASSASFDEGLLGSFRVTTSASPVANLAEVGPLPRGVTFANNGDGTATLAGTPAAGTAGVYDFTIIAANGVGNGTSQAFALTINPADSGPALAGSGVATFRAGVAGSFVFTAAGTPTPAFAESGALPAGLTFVDNHDGTATLAGTPAAGTAGVYHLTITASNGIGTGATEDFTLNVAAAPRAARLQRFGRNRRNTQIVLAFDQAMAPATVQDPNNYVFRPIVRGRVVEQPRRWIGVVSASYNPADRTVSLRPAKELFVNRHYQLTAIGLPPAGLTDASGILLDGQGNGLPGSNLVVTFGGRASLRGIPIGGTA